VKTGKEFISLLVKDSSEEARYRAFHQTFVQQYPRCFSERDDGSISRLIELGMFNWKSVDCLELTNTVNKLNRATNDLEQTIETTLQKCRAHLPLERDLPVWILPGDSSAQHLLELNGLSAAYVPKSDGIVTVIYPINGWLVKLPFVLAHEHHHVVYRAVKPDFNQNLLGRVITEGLADDFANRLFPGKGPTWTTQDFSFKHREEEGSYRYLLKAGQVKTDGGEIERYLQKGNYSNGTRYAGRAIAYRIVQGFISSHQFSLSDLLDLDPEYILRNSTYHPV
jgi:uncharacterized protein YjaZ